MTAPIWITPSGNLGIIPELQYYELPLDAYNQTGGDLVYSLISGHLPAGIRLQSNGTIVGIPINGEVLGVPSAVSKVTTSTFTIRVKNNLNSIADRTFSLTVGGILPPVITPTSEQLGYYIDGTYVDIQLEVEEANYLLTPVFSIISGELPPGLTLTPRGRIYGYVDPVTSEQTLDNTGFDVSYFDSFGFDFIGVNVSKNFQFIVQVNDGVNVDTQTYNIFIYARTTLTADSTVYTADNVGVITADTSTIYSPILYTPAGLLDNLRQNCNFAYKLEAKDFDNDVMTFNLVSGTLPTGLSLNSASGWITGLVPYGPINSLTYSFSVNVTKESSGIIYSSETKTFSLRLLGQIDNTVNWTNNYDLGTIFTGDLSELSIIASTASGKNLTYNLLTPGALPAGLDLLIDGTISGRVTFETFSNDCYSTTYDGGLTQFDHTYRFTVAASDPDGYCYDEKTFVLTVAARNKKPYENLYIQLLPNRPQRAYYDDIINNSDIFPTEFIYRNYDPWFGKNTTRQSLFLTGLNPAVAASYVNSMTLNHYWKTLTFGAVKTAQALDENFDVKYEVVYIEIVDNGVNAEGYGPNLAVSLPPNSRNVSTIYPNSFPNMATRMINGIGYEDQGALPLWMKSRQPNGTVLGFTRAMVLCYTVPGKSAEIAYRVNQVYDQFNLIDFTIDRYEWDSVLSEYFVEAPYSVTANINSNITSNLITTSGTNLTSLPYLIPGQTIYIYDYPIGTVNFINNANCLTLTANANLTFSSNTFNYSTNVFMTNNYTIGTGNITANTQSNVLVGLSTNINGAGTISGNTISNFITGNNTSFNTQLTIGRNLYYMGNSIGIITSIKSANLLTVSDPLSTTISNVAYTAQGISTLFTSELHVGDTIRSNIANTQVILGTVKSITSNNQVILTSNSTANVSDTAYSHTVRDPYTIPGQGDKYLKYPQVGVIS